MDGVGLAKPVPHLHVVRLSLVLVGIVKTVLSTACDAMVDTCGLGDFVEVRVDACGIN